MPNIARVLEQAVERHGDAVAYGSISGGVTYAQMYRSSVTVASRLTGSGARRAIVAEPNSPLIPAAVFGAAMAGVAYAPLNFRLPEAARTRLRERLAPAVVITPDWLAPDGLATAPEVGTIGTGTETGPAAGSCRTRRAASPPSTGSTW